MTPRNEGICHLRVAWDRNWPATAKPHRREPRGLTEWDRNFLLSLSRWPLPLTAEQRSVLRWIASRAA